MAKKNKKKKLNQKIDRKQLGAETPPIQSDQTGQISGSENSDEKTLSMEKPTQPTSESAESDLDLLAGTNEDSSTEMSGEIIQETQVRTDEEMVSEDFSMDDLLADVRHSLIEEDTSSKDGKKSSWWNRLVKGTPAQEESVETVSPDNGKEIPTVPDLIPESETSDTDQTVEEIDELIKLLEIDTEDEQKDTFSLPPQEPLPLEQEKQVDVVELKKQAFTPRLEDEASEELSDVRQVALGGEDEVFVEVEAKAVNPWEERLQAFENSLRPYRTYIYYGLAFLGVVMAVMAISLVYTAVKRSIPTPVATEALSLPYPTNIVLPGGLSFNLAKGEIIEDTWNPRGPEWLKGTEICRWVALPWSRPLEAAVRAMSPDDIMELRMSNNDIITYHMESIRELTPAELQEMDSSTPCLVLILAKQDSEKRWVAIGRP